MPAVDWRWWLVHSSDMSQIAELNAHQRQLQVQLNSGSGGKASCWIHLLDQITSSVIPHQTALRLDRNNTTVWSGPIYSANESSEVASTGQNSGKDQLQITAMGWQEALNHRDVHIGTEFTAMIAAANGQTWQAQNGTYTSLGVDAPTQLAYSAITNPSTTDAAIIFDLLNRANIDSPTLVTPGSVYGSPLQRNLTIQRFANVGQQITQLSNVEAGVDFYVDPLRRTMNLYGLGASSSPTIPNGMGIDRGQGVLFTYPGNCTAASRSGDGTKTNNRIEAIGQFAVGRADDVPSQQLNGLFETTDSLSDVVDPNILIAYANAEVAVRSHPWTIISFTPRALTAADSTTPGVPRPFQDFNLGDIVYCTIDRGPRMQIGNQGTPQATRVFGWTTDIDDNGVEHVSSLQTTYQGLGAT